MIDKIGLGISFFDEEFGGVYRGRQVLCIGRHGTEKSVVGYHFAEEGLQNDEKVLLLSDTLAKDTLIIGASYGFDFSSAVHREQLTLLEYAGLLGASGASSNVMLPPDAFVELQDVIETHAISRVILDTVLPWVVVQPTSRIAEHVYSFVHALERLGVSTLMTLPKPASNAAFLLKKHLAEFSPVVISLENKENKNKTFCVTKYLGASGGVSIPQAIDFVPGRGIVVVQEGRPASAAPAAQAPVAQPGFRAAEPSADKAAPARPTSQIRFSDVIRRSS